MGGVAVVEVGIHRAKCLLQLDTQADAREAETYAEDVIELGRGGLSGHYERTVEDFQRGTPLFSSQNGRRNMCTYPTLALSQGALRSIYAR